jgi:hypothetical protein
VLFDASISTNDKTVREHYFEDFKKMLGRLHGGTQLEGDVITANSMATATFPLNNTIGGFDQFEENQLTYKEKMDTTNKDIIAAAQKIIDSAYSQRTDLMNAFQLAGKVFNEDRFISVKDKVLVIFSDMIEDSGNYSFDHDDLTTQRISSIIKEEEVEGRMPNLAGVKVYVVGATANSGSQQQIKPAQIYAIEKFWIKYFSACGAQLTDSRYATRLLNFEY